MDSLDGGIPFRSLWRNHHVVLMRNVYTCLVDVILGERWLSGDSRSASIVQYETLEWAWNLARKYEDKEDGVSKFRTHVMEILMLIAEEGAVDFVVAVEELRRDG